MSAANRTTSSVLCFLLLVGLGPCYAAPGDYGDPEQPDSRVEPSFGDDDGRGNQDTRSGNGQYPTDTTGAEEGDAADKDDSEDPFASGEPSPTPRRNAFPRSTPTVGLCRPGAAPCRDGEWPGCCSGVCVSGRCGF